MERIWAPWRLAYVKSPHNKDAEGACIFCEFPGKDDDDEFHIFLRREHCFGMLNRYPYNNGHLLIAPYCHVADLSGLPDEVVCDVMAAVRDCVDVERNLLSPQGFNVGLNLGEAAGAGIAEHIHWHIVPRWNGDTNFMPVIADTKVIPQSLKEMYELLAANFRR